MSDNNDAQSFAAAGSGKSEAEVAFDLLNKLKGQGVWGERNLSAILDQYAECLDATKGLRAYAGQNRVNTPVKAPAARAAAPAQAPAPQAAPSQPVQQAPAHAAPQQTAVPQPVHAQQQALAQAYKPQ